jgi:hypothetical protein
VTGDPRISERKVMLVETDDLTHPQDGNPTSTRVHTTITSIEISDIGGFIRLGNGV